MIALFALLLAAGQIETDAPAQLSSKDRCRYDPKSLGLGFDAFDQDVTAGWRVLYSQPGCEEAAADFIRAYRMNAQSYLPLLYWHEAQLRAETGNYTSAIPLMEKAREPTGRDKAGWNAYVDATVAFLPNNRAAMVKARERLAALPKPSNVDAKRAWPPNLSVVDGLIRCFGKSYKIAYGPACRNPTP